MNVNVRPGGPQDHRAIALLHADSWRTAYAGIVPAEYLNGPDLFPERLRVWRERTERPAAGTALFVAEDATGLCGFVYLAPQPDGRVLLDNLHARPDRVGTGVGARLLRRALAWAAVNHRGADVYLTVLRDNARAIAFYERQGGRRTAEGTARFAEGIELPEYVYTWPATTPPVARG
jgi:GNAT superfamily N-acetyltransferase